MKWNWKMQRQDQDNNSWQKLYGSLDLLTELSCSNPFNVFSSFGIKWVNSGKCAERVSLSHTRKTLKICSVAFNFASQKESLFFFAKLLVGACKSEPLFQAFSVLCWFDRWQKYWPGSYFSNWGFAFLILQHFIMESLFENWTHLLGSGTAAQITQMQQQQKKHLQGNLTDRMHTESAWKLLWHWYVTKK